MIRLIFQSGARAGTELTTAGKQAVRIGRDADTCELVIDDPGVAPVHLTVERRSNGAYALQIIGPPAALRINGIPATTFGQQSFLFLSPGDSIALGTTEIELGDGQPRLVIAGGGRAGLDLPIGEEAVTIGRSSNNTVFLDDPKVSGHHAAILCLATGFVLRDNGSTNGTFVNGQKTDGHLLSDGDTIAVGDSSIHFLIEDVDGAVADRSSHSLGASSSNISLPGADVFGHLDFIAGPHSGVTLPLGTSELILGRRPECTFVLRDVLTSGRHLRVVRVASQFVLTDLGSTNGTQVNHVPLTGEVVLRHGDLIELGECVLEFRLVGGMHSSAEATLSTIQSVIADGAYLMNAKPRFVINGQVENQSSVTIGQAPSCTLRLDGEHIDPLQCTIVWEGNFFVVDQSRSGTYLSGKRVVKEKLHSGHVLQVGKHLINVSLRGERCTLETIDASTALAAVQVARETSFDLSQAVKDKQNSGFVESAAAYKTVFQLAPPDTSALVRERKAQLKQGAPAWRPSSDITGDRTIFYALGGVTAAALVLTALLHTQASDAALLNHPLSQAHASQRFADAARAQGASNTCQACHSLGGGVTAERCTSCHPAFAGKVRLGHLAAAHGDSAGHTPPGAECVSCHSEHRGEPPVTPGGEPGDDSARSTFLGAIARCADGACHPDQHSQDFARKGPVTIAAGPVPSFNISQEALHVAHAAIRSEGQPNGIGCTACHASIDDTGALQPSAAGWSCFRCHDSSGGREQVNSQCLGCHVGEHDIAPADIVAPAVGQLGMGGGPDMLKTVVSVPGTGGSLLMAGALALAAFLPLIGLGVIRWRMRSRLSDKLVSELQQYPVETVKRLVHSINVDKCVGCQMCVQACPTNVLELVNHKSVVVNFDACIQCRRCENACAFDALRMHEADKPPPMISMPEVDSNYMTPVEGMYLIGQASGTPQIKNAANLGHAVVQHMLSQGFQPGTGARLGAQYDVIVVGSGPAGLSAAISCAQSGLSYICLEKQRGYSWTIRNYYHKGKPVMAEPNDVKLVSLLPHADTVREQLLSTWDQYIQHYGVKIQYSQNVTDVKRDGQLFTVTVSDTKGQPSATYTAARVVLGIGTMGNPRTLRCPGDDLEKVQNALVDPDEYRGKNIVIVGGTDSAIEVVLALAEHNRVWMSCRGAKFDRVKPKNLELIEAAFKAGTCTPLFATVIKAVTPTSVVIEHKADKREETLPNDFVFAMIGGDPPIKWLQSIGVPYVDKPHSWSPPRTDEIAKLYQG